MNDLIPKYRQEQKKEAQKRKEREGGYVSRSGNYYTDEEMAALQEEGARRAEDGDNYLERWEAAKWKAAAYLNKEFPDVSKGAWAAAISNPDAAQFTSKKKEDRFRSAQKWVDKQASLI